MFEGDYMTIGSKSMDCRKIQYGHHKYANQTDKYSNQGTEMLKNELGMVKNYKIYGLNEIR